MEQKTGVRAATRPGHPARRAREAAAGALPDRFLEHELVPPQHVDVVSSSGESRSNVSGLTAAPAARTSARPRPDSGVPQDQGVDQQTQRPELVLLTLAVSAAAVPPARRGSRPRHAVRLSPRLSCVRIPPRYASSSSGAGFGRPSGAGDGVNLHSSVSLGPLRCGTWYKCRRPRQGSASRLAGAAPENFGWKDDP